MDVGIKILQRKYKKERDPYIRERILMIIELKRGESTYSVAKRLGCSQAKVVYWKHRFRKDGLNGLKTKPRSGKPRKLSDRDIANIKRRLGRSPYGWKTKAVREIIYKDYGVMYCYRHVMRLMHKWGFGLIRPRKKNIAAADEKEIETFKKMPKKLWIPCQKIGQR